MQGDNPENEDWCTNITIKKPKAKKELIENLYTEVYEYYKGFDVEEETYLMLEAKRNGFQGVPGVVALVHNEEYKENSLKEFSEKLGTYYKNEEGRTMENIIRDMIVYANLHHNEDMAGAVYELLSQFAQTFNCPSNWIDLGEQMAQEYAGNDWVMENCKLWNF